MATDNYITPEKKARWGFGGSKSEIKVGRTQEKADEKPADTPKADKGPTVNQLKDQLDAKGIEYSATAKKAELQALLDESEKSGSDDGAGNGGDGSSEDQQ